MNLLIVIYLSFKSSIHLHVVPFVVMNKTLIRKNGLKIPLTSCGILNHKLTLGFFYELYCLLPKMAQMIVMEKYKIK